jgi:hypothetical protein
LCYEEKVLLTLNEMKKFIITSILAVLVTAGTPLMAQDYPDEYLGLPGDNLNLYAVMNLFQESQTLEDFERNLNDANSRINNLDLNGDNLVDYITVNDFVDGNVHNIVLRVALNQYETQDVAVFTVQRFNDGTVQIQLVGDEALYGRNYIVEPIYDNNYAGTYNPGYTGRARISINVVTDWPLIRFIFYPGYISWHSSWYWGYYPSYWNPWRPYYWHYYYGYHYNNYRDYYRHYRRWNRNRYARYDDFYFSRIRSHSPMLDRRIREGGFRDTYSRPEMRREGEASYARMNAGRNQGRPDNSITRSRMNPSSGQRPNASERQAPSVSSRSVSRPSSVQRSNDVQRRSAPSVSNRSVSRPESVQKSSAPQRSAPSVSNRSVSKPESVQRSSTPQRSQPSVSNRSYSRPESSQRPSVTQRQSGSSGRSGSRLESVQRSDNYQRSAPSVSNRSASRPESVQRSSAPQRSSPSVSSRSASRSESAQRSNAPQRSAPSVRSSSPGSSRNNSRESSVKRNDNNRGSGSAQSSRRR